MRALLLLLAMTAVAHAGEHDATFAKAFEIAPDKVEDVVGYELPAGNDATHVLVGRYASGAFVMTGALIERCDERACTWRRAEFGAAEAIDVTGVFDLHGAPAALPTRGISRSSGRYVRVPGARNMKFPVVAIATRESKAGVETRRKLYLISLLDSDRGSIVLMDTSEERGATGRGYVRTYRLDKGESKEALDVIAKEQRLLERRSRCRLPEPVEAVFALEERHYRTKKYALAKGC